MQYIFFNFAETMASKYDEDVYENPFFTKIISEHQDHLERAASCKGIVSFQVINVIQRILHTLERFLGGCRYFQNLLKLFD